MHLFLAPLIIIFIFACMIQFYIIISYINSDFGKYPPFLPSIGKMRTIALKDAHTFLQMQNSPITITDLGCGDGGLLRNLAKEFPQNNYVGYEWGFVPYTLARLLCKKHPNIKLYRQNFFDSNWANNELIICYCAKGISSQISQKMQDELKNGTKIISMAFKLPNLKNQKILETKTFFVLPLKVYTYIFEKN